METKGFKSLMKSLRKLIEIKIRSKKNWTKFEEKMNEIKIYKIKILLE